LSDAVFYLTTPIYYVNDVPHLGHAYTTVHADFISRWQRMRGREVIFLTGTDEHGQKILRTAEKQGLSPKDWADSIVPRWKEVWEALDISNDDFIRTTDEERHELPVQKFWQGLYDKGEVYKDVYEGLYCVGCEAFKTEDELVDGKCPLHHIEPELVREDNYFFQLGKYADRLIELYETNPRFVMPEARRNEVLGKVRQGLSDLSMSRASFDWGIPVPWDESQVIYVWLDALQNYLNAAGYGNDEDKLNRVWPANVHLVGKDILWFHAVIWPAMLMAAELPLPETVFAHGFLQVGGEKMSKSTATGISPHDLLSTFGSDGFRYYFVREISFGQDGTFSWEGMLDRYNADLANDLGNLASRVLNMIKRYLGGIVPEAPDPSELRDEDKDLMETQASTFDAAAAAMEQLQLTEALKSMWVFVRKANAYVEAVAPWALAKDEAQKRRLEVVLYQLTDALRLIALLTYPIVPRAAAELWRRLGLEGDPSERTHGDDGRWGLLPAGVTTTVGDPLFPRLEEQTA
jgi:methionyl-tRNA synthetase